MSQPERRSDAATAEKIEMALKTKRAFDDHSALRFVELSGIPDTLAREVLSRPFEQTRQSVHTAPIPHVRRDPGED